MKRATILFAVLLLSASIIFIQCNTELSSAKLAMQQQNYDKVIEDCNQALETSPNNPEVYFVLGQAYGHKKMYMEMNDAFAKSLENGQKYANEIEQHRLKYWIDVFNSGVNQIKQDKVAQAIDNFKFAIALMPDRIDAYKNLAYAYSQNDQDADAVDVYKAAIEQAPEDLEIKTFLGTLYYQTKQYDNAIEVLSGVLEKADPASKEYNDALYNIAYSYDLLGQSDKAIDMYNKALETTPNDKDLIFNMGRLYYMQDNYMGAIESFQRVLGIDSEDFDANLNIGNSYIQIAQTIADEARAIDDKGNPVLSEKEIAEKEAESIANFKKAIENLEKAVELKADNANAWQMLGVAYIRIGEGEKGKEAFDKSEALRGN